jgi:two-component system chemotaxis response regulator CheY
MNPVFAGFIVITTRDGGPLRRLAPEYQPHFGEGAMAIGKILIVDDEEDVRDVLKLHLEQEGYQRVLTASDGEEAIRILRQGDNLTGIGLILCDIRMPKINGVEAIDYFKKEAPGIPIIVITGYPDTELAVSLMKKGVKDYLVKPVEKEKLLEMVDSVVAAGKDFEY